MPRGLIFLASLWLVGSLVIAVGVRLPVQASSASFEPGVRLLLQCVVIGLMIAWPLLRLSQQPTTRPIQQTLLDLVVLLTLIQVVIWVPRLLTNWTVPRTAALDATVASWTVLAGAIVATVVHSNRPSLRTAGMLVCVVLCLLGPLAYWIGLPLAFDTDAWRRLGPILEVRRLTEGGTTPPSVEQWRWIIGLGASAVTAWVLVGGMHVVRTWRRKTIDTQTP